MARTVGSLKTTISLDDAQFEQSLAGVNRQLRGLKAETRAVTSSGTGFARGVTEMRSKADVLTRTLTVQEAKVAELRRAYEISKRETGENSKQTQEANTAYQRAQAEMNRTQNQLKWLTEEIERQTDPWQRLGRGMESAGEKMQTVGRGMSQFGRSWSTRVTAPIVGLGAAALKVGMDFEEGMSEVQAISGATGEEFERLKKQSRDLGATTRFSAREAAEGQKFLAMAGLETNEIIGAMPGLLDLAASSNMDLGRAADIASNIMSAFNLEADEAGHVSDVLASAASNANTNVEQMGEAMKYLAPTASTLGLSMEESAAAVMSFSNSGIQGSMAGRAFGTSLTRLSKPTDDMVAVMEELNVSFFDAEGAIKPLPDIVSELEQGMEGYTKEQRSAALTTLFGSEAQRHWAILLDEGSKSLSNNSKMLKESEGAAADMAKTMEDNAKGSMREFRSAAEEIGIAFSEHMLPTVTDMLDSGTEYVRKFGEMEDSTQKNIIKMGLFAAAIGPVGMALGGLTQTIGGLLRGGGRLLTLLGASRGAGLLGRFGLMGIAGGPVGLAIGGIAALGLGIYGLTKDSEKLHDINLDVAQSLSDQHAEISIAAEQYEELRRQSHLTTEEFGELLDVREELAKNPEGTALEELQERYEELRKKSGLTNEQLDAMIEHNNTIVENAPQTAEAHSEQGNAIAGVNEKLEEYLDTLRETSLQELELERIKFEENKLIHLEKINEAKEKEREINEKILMLSDLQKLSDEEVSVRLTEIGDLKKHYLTTEDEIVELTREEEILLGFVKDGVSGTVDELQNQLKEQKEIIENNELELEKGQAIDDLYAELYLKKLGINEAGQKGIDLAEEQLEKLRDEISDLEKIIETQGDYNGETSEQIRMREDLVREHEEVLRLLGRETDLTSELVSDEDKREARTRHTNDALAEQERQLERNRGKLAEGTSEAEELNSVARLPIDKDINISTKPTIGELDANIKTPVRKPITLYTTGPQGLQITQYATGTDNHPGGPFVAGEEGWELGRLGDQWEMLNFGLYDRPSGYEVFTHDESKRILRSLNNLPAYADGARPSNSANRTLNTLNNNSQQTGIMIDLLKDIAQGIKDGKVVNVNIGRDELANEMNYKNAVDQLVNYF